MKKQFLLLGVLLLGSSAFTQQLPTNTLPGGVGPSGQNNSQFWSRAGNNNSIGSNNIFGTLWNSPIYTVTNGVNRTRLNGTWTTLVNGVTKPFDGYFGIGPNGFFQNNTPWSMLHLEGPNNVPQFGGNGWRRWMETGVFMKENSDAMYVGLKQEEGSNRSDAVVNWSDDPVGGGSVDKLRFIFTSVSNGNGTSASPLSGAHLDGYEFMRMQPMPTLVNSVGFPIGHVGIGPVFALTGSEPQSRLHMNGEDRLSTFLQITSHIGTGQTGNDGLRLGIISVDPVFTNGFLRWQENTPFIIQSEWDNTSGNTQNGERMRISSIDAPNVPDPANPLDNNITRVSISHRGSNPITQPRSLLHLGYNTGALGNNLPQGWRNWMDIGTFTAAGTDNMYMGLKEEAGDPFFGNRYDAVINWGDDQSYLSPAFPNGPDALRFIFTADQASTTADSVSKSNRGLEVARMEPGQASTLTNNFGMIGIGDFSPSSANVLSGNVVDAKLDIDGDLRVRTVTQNEALTQMLVIDPNDNNRVHWRTVPTGGGGGGGSVDGAHNGTSMSTINTDNVALGQNLFDPNDPAELLSHREIPMNDFNLVFTDDAATSNSVNRIGIGTDGPLARLHVKVNPSIAQAEPIGLRVDNNQNSTTPGTPNRGIVTTVQGLNAQNLGVDIDVRNGSVNNTGVNVVTSTNVVGQGFNGGGSFRAQNGSVNEGVGAVAYSPLPNLGMTNKAVVGLAVGNETNIGGEFRAQALAGPSVLYNYGIRTTTVGNASYNVGIDARVFDPSAPNSFAGVFDGNVTVSGNVSAQSYTTTSDQQFKQDINDLNGAMALIQQLQPRTFLFDTLGFPQFQFESDQQMGFVAQELETVIPNLVSTTSTIPELDSVGAVVTAAISYKQVEYTELIPLLTAGMQEQQAVIDSQQNDLDSLGTVVNDQQNQIASRDSLIDNLNDRLTQLENCLANILPALCNASNHAPEQTPQHIQDELRAIIDVNLSDGNNIVLNQNVPNPFAERTVITYSIPSTVGKAQIHFYDAKGALINTVDINERGDGQLNVFASDLSYGMYTYSLVADGKVVATKRMVKQ